MTRSLATVVLAVSAPVALLSGILTFVTIPVGVPSAALAIFMFALGVTLLAALAYLAAEVAERSGKD